MGPDGIPLEAGSQQVGEVQCKGPTVFQGYWQLPQASAEAFSSDGWFRTGDLATINQHGYITVVDRIKDMILHGTCSLLHQLCTCSHHVQSSSSLLCNVPHELYSAWAHKPPAMQHKKQ